MFQRVLSTSRLRESTVFQYKKYVVSVDNLLPLVRSSVSLLKYPNMFADINPVNFVHIGELCSCVCMRNIHKCSSSYGKLYCHFPTEPRTDISFPILF